MDKRLFGEAVLWIARAEAPWRDLPEEFGPVRAQAQKKEMLVMLAR